MNNSDLVVDSVTGVDVVLRLAGPGARAYAFLIDWFIRAILFVAWYVVAALIYNGRWSFTAPFNPNASWFVFVVTPAAAIYFLYQAVLEIAMHGRTPGKRMAGLHIITRDGGAPGIGALLTRNVFRLIDSLPLFYGVGLVTTMLTRDNIRVGDMAAGTILAYDRADVALLEQVKTASLSAHDEALKVALLQRSELWETASGRAHRLASGQANDATDAARMADDYRLLAHDLARVRRLMPNTRTREYLEAAYARAHATLHRGAWHPGYAVLTLFRDEIPAVVSWLKPHIIWAASIFILTVSAGYWMVHTYPDLIGLFASPDLVATVERGQLWTDGILNVVPSSVLSLQILTNNIVVSLFAYCAGFLFGLGTLYILGLNGLMLGAVFAFTGLYGLGDDLFRFIVAHGCVEISVMCLSGAAGAAVGEALIRPTHASRMESFRVAALRSGKLLIACVVLLIGSGIIEGYVSPNPRFPLWSRIVIGVVYWLFMIALLRGWLFRGRRRVLDTPVTTQGFILRQHSSLE
jgi:uncharacterized membrane protein SpoIIM required for sporulation/uncharacterized RDD family membrane protein YckC